ncbi:hypothetical protein JK361_22705 [Streptomyces sp. 5-8]|uniref:Transposase n=1 Tax=Streptomyces musisoli TaxID=2802280 RepID=A0ABS1P623_9ACTN|nr:hypothetical protein [Streptomyces musisoli]MBL1107381.1 hypothetical protein [Streptomyces musisoli]
MSLLSRIRHLTRPGTGRRRANHPRWTDETVAMLRPVEALATDTAWCPAERETTLHSFLRMGGRICLTCRTLTTDPTPPGGAE